MTRDSIIEWHLEDEAATEALGRELAAFLTPGMLVCLSGDLGAGKTTLARALIRKLIGNPDADVPSPTFAIAQVYEDGPVPVAHFDFYRLGSAAEVDEVGFAEALDRAVVLVEWPEKAGNLPPDRIDVRLETERDGRRVYLSGLGQGAETVARLVARRAFLDEAGWGNAERDALPGDASTRRYERVTNPDGSRALLMDMPARPDGPPVRNGLPYSRIAHLAEDASAVVAVNQELKRRGYAAPEVMAFDLSQGFVLIEDFGTTSFNALVRARADLSEPFAAATSLLAAMATETWPSSAPVPGHAAHAVPPYDLEALLIEAELLVDWFAPAYLDRALPDTTVTDYRTAWTAVLETVATPDRPVWTLRDFHVDNLFWLPDREGHARVGLIDTQDCVRGHPAYDLVSMLQDARVDIAADTESDFLAIYCEERRVADPSFDEDEFRSSYAILGAQRAAKILGIFTRLSKRDGKHGYLRHLSRVARLFAKNLSHPALAPVKAWFDRHASLDTLRERLP